MKNLGKYGIVLEILNGRNITINVQSSFNMSMFFQIADSLQTKTEKQMDRSYLDTKWLNLVLYLQRKLELL